MKPSPSNTLRFWEGVLRHPASIGAIAPSSEALAKAMVSDLALALADGDLLIELGPGTGAFTAEIASILPRADAYLGIEREPVFVELLQRQFPALRFVT